MVPVSGASCGPLVFYTAVSVCLVVVAVVVVVVVVFEIRFSV